MNFVITLITVLFAFFGAGHNPHTVPVYYLKSGYSTAVLACNGGRGLFIGQETAKAWKAHPQHSEHWDSSYLLVDNGLQVVEGPVRETYTWTGACSKR